MKHFIATLLLVAMAGLSSYAQNFTLKSNELGGQLTNKQYFNGFGYNGENQSPQLSWVDAPAGTQSFAVTMYDLDAPTGSGFWHWVVFNIPADVHEIKSGAGDVKKNLMPAGVVQSKTDFGVPGYGGAAPPAGPVHRYMITVYALNKKLELNADVSPALVGFNIHFATIAQASMVVCAQHK